MADDLPVGDEAGSVWIALIRAIGGRTHAKLSMMALRDAATRVGFAEARTVLATGNLIFRSHQAEADLHRLLTGIITAHDLGDAQRVFLRRPKELHRAVAANPFPDAAVDRPGHLLVHFLESPPEGGAVRALESWPGPERVKVIGREVFLDYRDSIGTSRLTPAALDRRAGAPGTARNWNTVAKLIAAAGQD